MIVLIIVVLNHLDGLNYLQWVTEDDYIFRGGCDYFILRRNNVSSHDVIVRAQDPACTSLCFVALLLLPKSGENLLACFG